MVHAIMPGDTQRRTGRMPSWKALARCDFVWPIHDVPIEKFAFGDRTIPIHARTLGVSVPPPRDGRVLRYSTVCSGAH